MFQKVHGIQVNTLKTTKVIWEMLSLNRQVLLLRFSNISHCKSSFLVIYNSAKFSSHLWDAIWFYGVKFSQNSWVVPEMPGNKSTMLFKHWNNCLRSSGVYFLCSRTQSWHSQEWWLLCQESTLRKICLNRRPGMLSNYSSLLPNMSCFILGLSWGFSVATGWAALELGLYQGWEQGGCGMGCEWPATVTLDQQAVQDSWTPQAGPQLRGVSTQGKTLGDGVGHSIQLEGEGFLIFRRGENLCHSSWQNAFLSSTWRSGRKLVSGLNVINMADGKRETHS